MPDALNHPDPVRPWQEGSHAELLAALHRWGLDPARAGRWLWDPAPTPLNKGEWREQREGLAAPCPFLEAELPLLEAQVQWSRAQGGGTTRLLVLRHRGRLRWRKLESVEAVPRHPDNVRT